VKPPHHDGASPCSWQILRLVAVTCPATWSCPFPKRPQACMPVLLHSGRRASQTALCRRTASQPTAAITRRMMSRASVGERSVESGPAGRGGSEAGEKLRPQEKPTQGSGVNHGEKQHGSGGLALASWVWSSAIRAGEIGPVVAKRCEHSRAEEACQQKSSDTNL
jgi:hypothetical protein